eukprot:8950648-Alexandrium_andersonii.AAC.1
MHDTPHVQLRVVKAARAGLTLGKPEALQSLSVQGLPARRSRARATQAAPKLGAHPWLIPGWDTSGGRATYTSSST